MTESGSNGFGQHFKRGPQPSILRITSCEADGAPEAAGPEPGARWFSPRRVPSGARCRLSDGGRGRRHYFATGGPAPSRTNPEGHLLSTSSCYHSYEGKGMFRR
jgi:hypothetical protein